MNDKAQEFGLAGTHFANPHGLPDPSQRSTARDLADLTARLLRDHPMSRPLLGGQTFVYNGRVYARHIPLFTDPGGVQALKTGFTNEAGYNLAVSAWRNGQQFLMIVLGSRSRAQSFLDAKRLLRFGFVETGMETPPEPKPVPRRPVRRRAAPPLREAPPHPGSLQWAPVAASAATSSTPTARSSTSTPCRGWPHDHGDPMTLSTMWRQKQLEYLAPSVRSAASRPVKQLSRMLHAAGASAGLGRLLSRVLSLNAARPTSRRRRCGAWTGGTRAAGRRDPVRLIECLGRCGSEGATRLPGAIVSRAPEELRPDQPGSAAPVVHALPANLTKKAARQGEPPEGPLERARQRLPASFFRFT